jgi:hypothetical protein
MFFSLNVVRSRVQRTINIYQIINTYLLLSSLIGFGNDSHGQDATKAAGTLDF